MASKKSFPSSAVLAARSRRTARSKTNNVRIKWFIDEVLAKTRFTMKQRVTFATEHVRDKVVRNLSVPVGKITGAKGRVAVTERSKPGEFPRADTTQLMKTIFSEVKEFKKGVWDGMIGTPLKYGLILETKMNRSFLKRTLEEEIGTVRKILTGPIKPDEDKK